MSKSSGFFAFVAGVSIGVGIGILFAPEKGEKTRRKLKKKWDQAQGEVLDKMSDISEGMKDKTRYYKETMSERVDRMLASSSQKKDELISILEQKLESLKKEVHKTQQ